MKRIITFTLAMLFGCAAAAQTTTVSATVTDSDSTVWANGSWKIAFVPNPSQPNIGIYNIAGVPLSPSVINQNGNMDGSGVLSVVVYQNAPITPAGSSWLITVCPNAVTQCGSYNFTAVGSSMSLSSVLTPVIPAPRFHPISGAFGYNDAEAVLQLGPGSTYWNVTTSTQRCYTGSAWGTCAGGTLVSPLTTKGDIWGFNTVDARIPVGANGSVLLADSTQSLGVRWGIFNPSSCTLDQMLYYASTGMATTCLTLEPNLSISSGTLYVCSGGGTACQLGSSASASDTSVAIGASSIASTKAVAIGDSADATNDGVAIGQQTLATNSDGVAVGYVSHATGAHATALGDRAIASATNSVALGSSITASTTGEDAIGQTGYIYIDALPTGVTTNFGSTVYDYLTVSQIGTPGIPAGVETPASTGACSSQPTTTVANGTYYAKLVALASDGTSTQVGAESTGVSVVGGGTTGIGWSWTGLSQAYQYRIWVGTSPGGENSYFTSLSVPSVNTVSLCQSTTNGTAGSPPSQNGTGTTIIKQIAASSGTNLVNVDTTGKLSSSSFAFTGTSGYQLLPSGLILQWGSTGSIINDTPTTVNFPITFPHAALSVTCSDVFAASKSAIWSCYNWTTTGFTGRPDTNTATAQYLAIGY